MKKIERSRQFFRSLEAKSLKSRSLTENIADNLTKYSGSTHFLTMNISVFFVWIALNINLIPELQPFDPFPFGLLTMIVSLEAIILSVFVLISQNRSAHIATVREEVHLRVDLIAEEEVTKCLEILAQIRKKIGITRDDPEIEKMLERTDTNYIERSVAEQLTRANKPLLAQLQKEFPDILAGAIQKPVEAMQKPIFSLGGNGNKNISENNLKENSKKD